MGNILKSHVECTCEEFVAEVAGRRRKPYLDALKSTLVKEMSSFLRENEGKLERVSTGRRPPRRGRYGWCEPPKAGANGLHKVGAEGIVRGIAGAGRAKWYNTPQCKSTTPTSSKH